MNILEEYYAKIRRNKIAMENADIEDAHICVECGEFVKFGDCIRCKGGMYDILVSE